MATNAPWYTRPVFLSSTFKDTHAERDHLRNHVFPKLAEDLRERPCHFETIDLRMGVETVELASEEAKERRVLKVCLDETERSRPLPIVLLGDRYGWVPPEPRMKAAAQEAGFATDLTGKSVTALEVEFGILLKYPQQRRRCLFFFRDPLPYDQMPPEIAARFSDPYAPDKATRAGRPRDLWVSSWRIADILERQRDREAINWWCRAYDILGDMSRLRLFVSPKDQRFLEHLETKVGR
jgi:hypothetical protein